MNTQEILEKLHAGEVEVRKVTNMKELDSETQELVSGGKRVNCVLVWNGWGFFCR